MDEEEKKYQEDLKKSGVDLPELNESEDDTKDKKIESDKVESEKKIDKDGANDSEDDKSDDEDEDQDEDEDKSVDQPKKKRSIYDDLKDKKKEIKTERELRLSVEKERDELKKKLEDIQNAKSPEEKNEALDELEKFAEEIQADPKALKRMKEIFLKGYKPEAVIDESIKEELESFKQWKKDNSKAIAESEFNKEFNESLPSLKKIFPKASDAEMASIKTELDKISHSKGWEDKDLDYIAFKHQDKLNALISPKKKGLDSKENKDDVEISDDDFDPNADLSKMSPGQREKWYEKYNKAGKSEGLMKDGEGRMSIL